MVTRNRLGLCTLRLKAYTLRTMDFERFRAVLRELRKELVGSQGELSALTKINETDTPVNTMTISEIETGAIADPGIITVIRLIEALPGVSLSSFFARIEGLPNAVGLSDNSGSRLPQDSDDDAIPPSPEESKRLQKIGKAVAEYTRFKDQQREGKRQPYREPTTADSARKTGSGVRAGSASQRLAKRRLKGHR